MIKNLGQVAAIYIGSAQPSNTNLIWLDNTVIPFEFRAYDGEVWSELAKQSWVKMYIDGWLVSLPPTSKAEDGDYLLINSGNVNYKITTKEFVKSAVGNPLDFKGVIRTDSDFPNPSTCEAGDMYVIITSPAGGTVKDPYSGAVFEDTEKIVWDEVTKKWESLGKIEIVVDMDTVYAETKVTITNTTGKSTDITAATETQAGVMSAQMYYWLKFLSNGTIIPPTPKSTDPNTPAHQHNYDDIVDRLIAQQSTGQSTREPMSQKATTDALDLKFDKANVVQEEGAATDKVMSQKATTDSLNALEEWAKEKFTKYLKLAGGTMTGNIVLENGVHLMGQLKSGIAVNIAVVDGNNAIEYGSESAIAIVNSAASNIVHNRAGTLYNIWDTYNLPDPATLSGTNTFTGYNTFNQTTYHDANVAFTNGHGILGRTADGVDKWLINVNATNKVDLGSSDLPINIKTSATDIQHVRAGSNYAVWDKYNLPDPVTKSGDNVFTGNNTFQAQLKVPVAWSLVDGDGNGLIVSKSGELSFGRTTNTTHIRSAANQDLYHNKGGTNYAILDASNYTQYIPDIPAGAATQDWVNTQLSKYLPLTGGTVTGQTIFSTGSIANSIALDSGATNETFIQIRRSGTSRTAIGYYDGQGAYIYGYDVAKYLFIKSTGVFYGGLISGQAKLLTSADLGGYATQDWVKSQKYLVSADLSSYATQSWVTSRGYLTSASLSGYATQSWVNSQNFLQSSDLSGYATQSWCNGNFSPLSVFYKVGAYAAINSGGNELRVTGSSAMNVNYNTESGKTAPTSWYWKGGSSTSWASGYWGNLYMYNELVATQSWVNSQNFLQSADLNGYATQEWVTENFSGSGNYLPLTGGTLAANSAPLLRLNRTVSEGNNNNEIAFDLEGEAKGVVGWRSDTGPFLYNVSNNSFIGIDNDGVPFCGPGTTVAGGKRNIWYGRMLNSLDGYIQLGPILFQWGTQLIAKKYTATITLPTRFDAAYGAVVGWNNSEIALQYSYGVSLSTTTIQITNGDDQQRNFHWFAWGYRAGWW